MRRLLLLAALLLLAVPSSASAMTDPQIADASFPGHACTGQVQILMDPAVGARGRAGEATGVQTGADGVTRLVSCVVSVDPVWWAANNPYARCVLIVHEVGHLAGHGHEEHGVMFEQLTTYEPCNRRLSLTERVMRELAFRHQANVSCGKWKRGRLRCEVDAPSGTLRYVAKRRGNGFTLTRRSAAKPGRS